MRKKLNPADKLVVLQTSIPVGLREFIVKIAERDERTVSQVARRLLEASPEVKAAPPSESPSMRAAKEISEEVSGDCHEQQVGLGEWMNLQRTWEGKTNQEVWNEAVCHCADVLQRESTVKKVAAIIESELWEQ